MGQAFETKSVLPANAAGRSGACLSTAKPQGPEQRAHPRYAVDEPATLHLIDCGEFIQAHIADLSVRGCRLRLVERCTPVTRSAVEVAFTVNGVSFRFPGAVRWSDGAHCLGIQFNDTIARRKELLAEVVAELEAAMAKEAEQAAALAREQAEKEERARAEQAGCVQPAAAEPPQVAEGPADRRLHPRRAVDVSARILLIKLGVPLAGRVVDLSEGGCRIRCQERFPVGIYTRVEVEFRLGGLPFRLGGVIQGLYDRFTVGIRFLDMSPRKHEQVQNLMAELDRSFDVH